MSSITTPRFKPIEMFAKAGTTIQIGPDVHIQIRGAHRNRVKVHIYAPDLLTVQREVNFTPDYTVRNEDGPSAPTPEPSAT